MAGGKETPRQKMIGMMYLVLTCLLALNVSNTVIDKFVFLDDSLVRANQQTEERNIQVLQGIVATLDKAGNPAEDMKYLNAAREIRTQVSEVNKQISELKATVVEETGGYKEVEETGGYKEYQPEYPGDAKNLMGKEDVHSVGHYFMSVEEGGGGHGVELKKLLNDYAAFVSEKLKTLGATDAELAGFKPIAVDADEDPIYSKDPNQKGKDFASLAFNDSPTPAGLATLSEFQSRVLKYETSALDYLSSKVGASNIVFDQVVPMVNPESKYVAAGTKYSAKMFIAASSSSVTPVMYVNDKEIPVDGSGQGLVEFTAAASNYDKEGMSRQTFKAAIAVNTAGGKDTTYTQDIEYFVVKPTIQIQSQSVQALYFRCGNKLDVQVPQLGVAYNPSFTATNATALASSTVKGQVTIVPTSPKEVELKVSSNGNYIGSQKFGVRTIPAPVITPVGNQGPIDLKTGMSAKTPRMQLAAIPDESFKQFLPDDAKFRVAEATLTLVSGGIGRASMTSGPDVNLAQVLGQARKGDQLVIEIKRVQRQNFKGDVEDFPNFNRIITIGLQ